MSGTEVVPVGPGGAAGVAHLRSQVMDLGKSLIHDLENLMAGGVMAPSGQKDREWEREVTEELRLMRHASKGKGGRESGR